MVAAKKCRHCGEILDVAWRAAEEAKVMARSQHQPFVINNNVSSSSVASAATAANGHRKSLLRSFIRFIVVSFGLIFFGAILAGSGAEDFGTFLAGIGGMLLVIGIPIYLIRGVWRILFG